MQRWFSFLLFAMLATPSCSDRHEKPEPVKKPVKVESPDFKKGVAFLNEEQNDSAYVYFNRVTGASKDSMEIGRAYNNMARVQVDIGDYFGAQEVLLTSLNYLDKRKYGQAWTIASDYNELGRACFGLKNYETAIENYDLALINYDLADKDREYPGFRIEIENNKAAAFRAKGDYRQALGLFQSIYRRTEKTGKQYARVITNLAKTRWLADPGYNAAPELLKGLGIRKAEKDAWGQNSSYAHLADFYARSHPDSALFYAGKMYEVARILKSPDDQGEALEKLIKLDRPQEVKRHFEVYKTLADSLQMARNGSKNQFALVRYDVQKNKADNLRLQKENSDKKYQILWQWGLLGGALFLLIGAAFWYRKRRERSELEKLNAVQETELRNAKKVHDVLANGIYRTMSEVQYREDLDKEELLDQLDYLYNRSRDISKDDQTLPRPDFRTELDDLLRSFETEETMVEVNGNTQALWEGIGNKAIAETEHILLELMVNMRKHSRASRVNVRFSRSEGLLTVDYRDNGIGLPETICYGKGLKSTETRIKAMGGTITFESKPAAGLEIRISIPVA